MHALIVDGEVIKYPYSFGKLRADNPSVSFPKRPGEALLAAYNVYPVTRTDPPACDPIHERVDHHAEVIDGTPTQVWTISRRDDIPTVEAFADQRIAAINEAAGEVINATLPIHRQNNLIIRALELMDIRRERELTPEEHEEREKLEASRDWLKRQREEAKRLRDVIRQIEAGNGSDDDKRTAMADVEFAEVP